MERLSPSSPVEVSWSKTNIGSKEILAPQIILGLKTFWSKEKCLGPDEFLVRKNNGSEEKVSKKILVQKNFVSENFCWVWKKFWIWKNLLGPIKLLVHKQDGIKFEISWEPNFPVTNFARNNGKKSCHHPDDNQRKIVSNDKTDQKFTVKGSIYWWPLRQWAIKIKPGF